MPHVRLHKQDRTLSSIMLPNWELHALLSNSRRSQGADLDVTSQEINPARILRTEKPQIQNIHFVSGDLTPLGRKQKCFVNWTQYPVITNADSHKLKLLTQNRPQHVSPFWSRWGEPCASGLSTKVRGRASRVMSPIDTSVCACDGTGCARGGGQRVVFEPC